MKIESLNGMTIWESDGWGKTTIGSKKQSSIQVRQPLSHGYLLLFTAVFPVGNKIKRDKAIEKARQYIIESTT